MTTLPPGLETRIRTGSTDRQTKERGQHQIHHHQRNQHQRFRQRRLLQQHPATETIVKLQRIVIRPNLQAVDNFRFNWVSTLRALHAIRKWRQQMLRPMKTHAVLTMTEPPVALTKAHAVVMEIAPVSIRGYEHEVARMISIMLTRCDTVIALVSLGFRKNIRRITWAHRRSNMQNTPFKLCQVCSCTVDGNENFHHAILLGTNMTHNTYQYRHLPASVATKESAIESLRTVVVTFIRSLPEAACLPSLTAEGESVCAVHSTPQGWTPMGTRLSCENTLTVGKTKTELEDGHLTESSFPNHAKVREIQ